MNHKKLNALITLLDDPNPEVIQSVTRKFLEFSPSIVSILEETWLESTNPLLQDRLEEIIKKIEFNNVRKELVKWSNTRKTDLIEGAILVSKCNNPYLLVEPIRKNIEKIRTDVWLEFSSKLTALEKIRILNHIFFSIYNYHPLSPDQPKNWDGDIGAVVSQKQGNYFIIAILYAGIAQALKMPIYGINLSRSVVLCYKDMAATKKRENEHPVLFYINPIENGYVFGYEELEFLINQKKITNIKSYYQPCHNTILIKRLIEYEICTHKRLKLESLVPNFVDLFNCL